MLFKEDLIRTYADSRKDISYQEIEDLYKSIVSYLKSCHKNKTVKEVKLPYIGTLHRVIDYDNYTLTQTSPLTVNTLEMMIKEALGDRRYSPRQRKTKDEIQRHVNNHLIEN